MSYALTYPQLMSQALELGADETALSRLKTACELARESADGFYRGQGVPFIDHLVRTASITLSLGLPVEAVMAAVLHANYSMELFGGGKRNIEKDRARVRRAVGAEAEELVFLYDRTCWKAEEIAGYIAGLGAADQKLKTVYTIRLANELEDYLDLGMAYRGTVPVRERIEGRGRKSVELARALGHGRLADELDAAFEQHLTRSLPPVVTTRIKNAYESEERVWARRSLLQRVKGKARFVLNRMVNGTVKEKRCATRN
jgi:(p)ppGpp synthase/HD superfamily hydrolase